MRQFVVFDASNLWYVEFSWNSRDFVCSYYNRKDVVKPAFNGQNILAPTTKQQLQYYNYLSVYTKDKVAVSENMGAMVRKFHVCFSCSFCSWMPYDLNCLYQTVVGGWQQNSSEIVIWGIGSFCDLFDPSLIHDALADPTHGFKNAVFGWDTMKGTPGGDIISDLFIGVDGEFIHKLL